MTDKEKERKKEIKIEREGRRGGGERGVVGRIIAGTLHQLIQIRQSKKERLNLQASQ